MHALYLPGNSPENREPTYELASAMSGFESSTVIEYPHWPDQGILNIDRAADALAETFAKRGGDFTVIAKSIGVNLCLRAQTISKSFDPAQVVFIGAPINDEVRKHNPVGNWLKGYDTPSLWIQQTEDPVMPADELRQFLDELGVAEMDFVSIEGSSHGYDPDQVASTVRDRLAIG